jgi:hypothetical protein
MLSKLERQGYGGGTGAKALRGGLKRVPAKNATLRTGVSLVKAVVGCTVPRKTGNGVGAEAFTTGPASKVRVNRVTTGRNVVTDGPGGDPGAGNTAVPAVAVVVSSPSSRNPKIANGPLARFSFPDPR